MKLKVRELPAVRQRPEYWEAIERALLRHLRDALYAPILEELAEDEEVLRNAPLNELVAAIQSGRVRYVTGSFEGKFSAGISKALKGMGSKWDKKSQRWKLPESQLPADIRVAIEASEQRFKDMAARVDRRLAKILPEEIAAGLKLDRVYDTTIFRVTRDVEKSVQALKIQPRFTDEQARLIREKYTENMKLYIQEWSETEIQKLRKEMQKHVLEGTRYEEMIDTIRKSYGVSESKAKFLARQETNLLTSAIKESRYKDAGVNEYKWRCVAGSPAHPVRPAHKALDGKIFSWDHPPIVDESGHRKHPGEDYGCRCTAVPIVRFD